MTFIINNTSNYFEDSLSESPIERIFLQEIVKYLEIGTEIEQQKEFQTTIGNFRVDFLIRTSNLECIIELDGKEFHNKKYDMWRDSFLLGENKTQCIIRLAGKDIVHNLNECIYFLSLIIPTCFSDRGKINIATLIEFENKESIEENVKFNEFDCIDKFYLPIIKYEGDEIKTYPAIEINIRNHTIFKNWKKYFDYAHKIRIFNIDILSKKYSTML